MADSPDRPRVRLLAPACLVLAYGVFLALIWNRFFPIQEGWFHFCAALLREGKRPYADFYMFLPPAYPLLVAAIAKVFGNLLIVLRVLGVVERLAMLVVLYLWLRQAFPARYAAVAALASLTVYASATTDILYGYYQTCLFFCLLSGWVASGALGLQGAACYRRLFFAGLLAGVAFNVKQSTGLLVPVGIVFAASSWLLARQGPKAAFLGALSFGAGMALPCVAVVAWLGSLGALDAYWAQVFRGTSSKGSLAAILFGFWVRALKTEYVQPFAVAAAVALAARWRARRAPGRHGTDLFPLVALVSVTSAWALQIAPLRITAISGIARLAGNLSLPGDALYWSGFVRPGLAWTLGLVALVALAAWLWPGHDREPPDRSMDREDARFLLPATLLALACFLAPYYLPSLFNGLYAAVDGMRTKLIVVHVCFYATIVAFLALGWRLLRKPARVPAELWILVTVSVASTYSHGLSFTIEEHAVLVGLAVCVAASLRLAEAARAPLLRVAIYGGCCLLLVLTAAQRYDWPYEWFGWREPDVRTARVVPEMPELAGFRLSQGTLDVLAELTTAIVRHSRPGEPVFVFPHIPLLYLLADRRPETRSPIHYFDVCSDQCARQDAQLLRRRPPQVVVYLAFPEHIWAFHEWAFRNGRRSGQRDFQDLVGAWLRSGEYRQVAAPLTPLGYPIQVLTRVRPAGW